MNEDDIILAKTLTLSKFQKEINAIVERTGTDYLDAVVHYCNKNGIEVETVASLIKSSVKLKSAIQVEAENLNFIPKTSRLPV